MRRPLLIALAAAGVLIGAVLAIEFLPATGTALWSWSGEGRWLLPLVIAAALADSVNPCAFSVLLVTIAFLIGIGKLRSDVRRIGGWYIAGIAAAYLLIGVGIFQAFHLFGTPRFMGKLGAVLLVVLGLLQIASATTRSFPIRFRLPAIARGRMSTLIGNASAPAAFALGALVGICEFPCTGGPYLMVIGLLHDTATRIRGFGYLLLYNAIFVLPLIVMLAIAGDGAIVARLQSWQRSERRWVRAVVGVVAIALGAIVLAW